MVLIDRLNANSIEYARALSHPMRHRLLAEVGIEGATVSQLANRLSTNKGNIAHHLAVLVGAGLLHRGRTRTVRGGTEQYYERVSRQIVSDGGPDNSATAAMLENLSSEIVADPHALLTNRILRLTPPQAQALVRHLEKVVEEIQPASDRDRSYGVLVSVYRR